MPQIVKAISEEMKRLDADSTSSGDVINQALAIVGAAESSDMAKVRALELIADLRGWRQSKSADRRPDAPGARVVSAQMVVSRKAIAEADDAVKRLNAGENVGE